MHWVLLNLSGFEAPLKYFSVLISSKVMIFFSVATGHAGS